MMNDFGIKIPIGNLKKFARQGKFNSRKEISMAIKKLIEAIKNSEESILAAHELFNSCQHEWGRTTFTTQRRVFGFVKVFERSCSRCGHTEAFTKTDGISEAPEWTHNAREVYYNNNF